MATPEWHNKLRQEGLDDMTLISRVDIPSILANLEQRFMKDIIYTNIGDVLVCMNPFYMIPGLYDESVIQDYCGKSRLELPPHIYAIAEQAYRSMMVDKDNQCVIISGESGAGKTEAAKGIMRYIAAVSGGGGDIEKVKRIIMETNPLLEAFGNAKTLRNNNSSRFGKYFEIQFNKRGDPDGGRITNYLLEKSRVVGQLPGERNYHIFYQWTKAGAADEKQMYGIQGPGQFEYCIKGQCLDVANMDDFAEYADMRQAMNVIGITAGEQRDIFTMLAAILWTGNCQFREQNGNAQVADMSVVDFVASLLGVGSQYLKAAFEVRTMETKRGLKRGSTYKVPLNNVQATASRDALSKTIYDRLFDWLCTRVNRAMLKEADGMVIGVLDIFGFEIFDKNGFEQMCINYVNEKLQQIFIEFTLRNEQDEYQKEGIQWNPIPYFDNKVVCDLLEARSPPGIMHVLDDVCKSVHAMAEGADKAFGQRVSTSGGGNHKHFMQKGIRFCIKHYAGDVNYDIAGMVEKNKDALYKDLLDVTGISTNQLLVSLFPDAKGGEKGKKPTVCTKIRTQANQLYKTLAACAPHYVRCIKSNENKAKHEFDRPRITHQVKYLGLLDNIKVRRAGFAYRATYEKFLSRYMLLSKQTSYAGKRTWNGSPLDGCRAIIQDLGLPQQQYQIGRTKVFLKDPETLFSLEDLRERYWYNMAARITNAYRISQSFQHTASTRIKNAFLTYKYYRQLCATEIQRAYRAFKKVQPYHDPRVGFEAKGQFNKQRHRFSMCHYRKFFGDYMKAQTQQALMQAIAVKNPGVNSEQPVFSFPGKALIVPGIFGSPKISPRFIVLTNANLYTVALIQKKNTAQHKCERVISVANITGVSLSQMGDHLIVIHAQKPDWDICLELPLKTELAAQLSALKGGQLQMSFNNLIEWRKKKSSKNKLKFVANEQYPAPNGMFKKYTMTVGAGPLPAGSRINQPQMPQDGQIVNQVSHLREASVVITDDMLRAAGKRDRGARGMDDDPAPSGGGGGGGGGGRGRGGGGRGGGRGRGGGGPQGPKAKALWDYNAAEQDELSFRAGEIITILKKDGDWWEGQIGQRRGFLPGNYCEELG